MIKVFLILALVMYHIYDNVIHIFICILVQLFRLSEVEAFKTSFLFLPGYDNIEIRRPVKQSGISIICIKSGFNITKHSFFSTVCLFCESIT